VTSPHQAGGELAPRPGGSALEVSHALANDLGFAAVLGAAPDGVVVVDREGHIALLNAQARAMFGYPEGAMLGQSVERLVPHRSRSRHVGHRAVYAHDPSVRPMGVDLDLTGLRADGTEFPVDISLSTVTVGDGAFVVAFVRDASEPRRLREERHQLELRLVESQRLESLGLLAGGVAHDFNNLLAVILGNATLARMEYGEDAPGHRELDQIEQAAQRAGELTQQMLAYAGRGRSVIEPVAMTEVVRDMVTLTRTTLSKDAHLVLDLDDELPAIDGDLTQLRQVALNLITNASEALGGRAGTITVRTDVVEADRLHLARFQLAEDLPEGRYVRLEVGDTGVGISAEDRARIFEPFFTTKFTGRGLGLAAVLGIVRSHHGAIAVASEQNHGTTFTLLFPASHQPVRPRVDDAHTASRSVQGTALVVDDEPAVAAVAAGLLRKLGYGVVVAAGGAQALQELDAGHPPFAFVLLDLTMPGVDGDAVVEELERRGDTTMIILCSGHGRHELGDRFLGRGVAAFLQKPYRMADLRQAVREVMSGEPR
jgi:two-component system, cell cycle sensor histidine kinase and response regulator CckA